MSKHTLISAIAAKAGTSQDVANRIINSLSEYIKTQVKKGEPVQIFGLGKFSPTTRAERNGVNPKTLERIVIPAQKSVKFTASKQLKDSVR